MAGQGFDLLVQHLPVPQPGTPAHRHTPHAPSVGAGSGTLSPFSINICT
jgi:hypothetical protein